ncbi:MAG TPA: nucleotidyltransferase family protein [Balneolaceae bacterium]
MAIQTALDKTKIIQLLEDNSQKVREFGVAKLGLFGSYSKDEQTSDSDIDILVEFREGKKTYDNFIELAFFLEDILNKKVDLVTRASIVSWLLPDIEKHIQYVEYR